MDLDGTLVLKGNEMDRLLLRVGEAAEVLGISRAKAYQLVSSGALPSIQLAGSMRRVPVEELRKLIGEQLAQDSPP